MSAHTASKSPSDAFARSRWLKSPIVLPSSSVSPPVDGVDSNLSSGTYDSSCSALDARSITRTASGNCGIPAEFFQLA